MRCVVVGNTLRIGCAWVFPDARVDAFSVVTGLLVRTFFVATAADGCAAVVGAAFKAFKAAGMYRIENMLTSFF